jgi:hypothetical protein
LALRKREGIVFMQGGENMALILAMVKELSSLTVPKASGIKSA